MNLFEEGWVPTISIIPTLVLPFVTDMERPLFPDNALHSGWTR